MCADTLRVALVIPNIDAFSGGMERTLKLVEYSASAGIRYTCFEPPGGVPNEEVAHRLVEFERIGILDRRALDPRDRRNDAYDAIAIPTEYWWGPWRRARAAGLTGPFCLDFHQLPYIGTLDILKREGIDRPSLPDLARLPFLQGKVYAEGLLSSAWSSFAGVASVRLLASLRHGRILATTRVVEKNLASLGYHGPVYVPGCPNGISRAPVEAALEVEERPEFDGLYVGRFHPQKGFLDMPYIVARMKKILGPGVNVGLCGGATEPSHVTRFRNLVATLGVERNVTLLGRIPKADLYRTLRRSRVLLYPSYVDGFSLTILESLCLGVPVVAYNIDAVEMIWRRRQGVFSAPTGDANALGELASEIQKYARFEHTQQEAQRQSRVLLDTYRWEKVVLDERQFYEGVRTGTEEAG